jgi:hypothetical protein
MDTDRAAIPFAVEMSADRPVAMEIVQDPV